MTDGEEGDGEDDRDPDSESRFGKFLDRLDDRDAGDTDREAEDESKAAPDPPPGTEPDDRSEDAEPTGTDIPADRSTTGPDAGSGERVWDTSSDDDSAADSPGQSPRDDGGADDGARSADRAGPEQRGETADRWSAIDSGLDRAAVDPFSGGESGEPDPATGEASESPTDTSPESAPTDVPDLSRSGSGEELDRATTAASALVLGPMDSSLSETICSRFLTVDGESRDVIFVTFDQSPEDRIEVCHQAEWGGGRIGVIEVGRGQRGSAGSEITGGGGSITVRHVSKPGDLSKLGIVITQLLSAFDDTSRTTVLCFHTLSALHREVGTKTLFRFVSTLQGRLNSADAVGHYHMNPELHDEIVVETIRPIFDSIVRFSATGDLEVE